MHIKTESGWKRLQPQLEYTIGEAPERYRGTIPSPECKRFIREIKEKSRRKGNGLRETD
jgi:hypothetical protein